jgi:NAD(P)-dependent dehydrogenase (short-subunit alcohol dehydrogenase family)
MASQIRSVVVTGASSGIGRATALLLAQKGWQVFATVRNDSDVRALTDASDGMLQPLKLEITDSDSIAATAAEVKVRLAGRGLNAIVNNAGIGTVAPVEHTSRQALRAIYEINLFGQIEVIQAFLPMLRQARGRIVNIGSVGDYITPPFGGALASSKAAFAAMSAALRLEVRGQGIQVSVVEPGSINTPAVGKTLGGVEKTIRELPPEGRALYAESMRRMATTFEASERAGSPPERVAMVIERALTEQRPRLRYRAGKNALKIVLAARLLPERLLNRVILRTFGLSTRSHEVAQRRRLAVR